MKPTSPYLSFVDSEPLMDRVPLSMSLISANIRSRTFVDKFSTSAGVSPSVGIGSRTILGG